MAKQSWKSVFEVAAVGMSLLATSCGGDDDGQKDGGSDNVLADAGCPGPSDAGCPGPSDAGCPGPSDAGRPGPSDAGCPGPSDAGCPGPSDAGCPGPSDAGCPSPLAVELPSDMTMWTAWLDAKRYQAWHCDRTAQAPLPDSPHGQNIICVNDALWAARAGTGPFPVGAAAVKLVVNPQGAITRRYIDVRKLAGSGPEGWYFHVDGSGPSGLGSAPAVQFCADCHAKSRDYVRRIPSL